MQTASDEDYRSLDVRPGASLQEVKESYRELVQVWHPDKHSQNAKLSQRAHRKMVEINLAYERISKSLADGPRQEAKTASKKASSSPPRPEARHRSVEPWTNSLGMKFVPVPGTSVHFSIWEVRVQDYEPYAKDTRWVNRSWKKPGFPQTAMHPVVNVSLEDAREFCAWLTEKERRQGLLTGQQEYRLPTDTEWSWAVGIGDREGDGSPMDKSGGIKGVYPWGTQWPPPDGAGNYHKSYGTFLIGGTTPVGSYAPSEQGLFDLGGNVWEWCDNPSIGFLSTWGVLRGGPLRKGQWSSNAEEKFLSSYRSQQLPKTRDPAIGFRCVAVR